MNKRPLLMAIAFALILELGFLGLSALVVIDSGFQPYFPPAFLGSLTVFALAAAGVFYEVHHRSLRRDETKGEQPLFRKVSQVMREGVWISDRNERITYANAALADLLGRRIDELTGHNINEFLDEKSTDRILASLSPSKQYCDVCFTHTDGSNVWGIASLISLKDADSEFGRMGMVTDMTEFKKLERAYHENEHRYQDLFNSVPFSLWDEDFSAIKRELDRLHAQGVTDLQDYADANPTFIKDCLKKLVVRDVNPATLELYKTSTKAELFNNLSIVINDPSASVFQYGLTQLFDGKNHFETEGINYSLDRQPIRMILRWTVLPGYEDKYDRVIVSVFDTTNLLRAQDQLITAETRYRMLVEQISAVLYTDIPGENQPVIYMSPQVKVLTGYTAEEWMQSSDLWVRSIYPEDRERVQKENSRTNQTGEPFQIEYRMVKKDGQIVWVLDQAVLVWNEQFQIWVWQGVWLDITMRKRAEDALQESENRLRLLLESQGEGTVLFNLDGRFMFANAAAENLFQISGKPISNSCLADFMTQEQCANVLDLIHHLKSGENTALEIDITLKSGSKRWLLVTLSPWFETPKQLTGGLAVCRDNTQRRNSERALQFQSTHDPLTGLYNRWYFEDRLAKMARGNFYPVGLVVADVDGLKRINDIQGHLVGDAVLCRAAQVLLAVFRAEDVVARIGGDEIAILLPYTNKEIVDKIIERIYQRLEFANQLQPNTPLNLSMGSSSADNEELLSTAFHQADQAMYQEKKSKRAKAPDNFRS
jgi:diguanylate cyclase (GGDEF)-like protein/PAS domain S-box-containing protein